MNVEQKIFEEAKKLIKRRYPEGWGGAAAMYYKKGHTYTSFSCARDYQCFYSSVYRGWIRVRST